MERYWYPKSIKLEMYKTLRQEQLEIQKRMETLYRWAIVAAAVAWGFMFSNYQNGFCYLIGLAPAILAPFIYQWVSNLAYSGYRIAIFVRSNCENNMKAELGWESWLYHCRNKGRNIDGDADEHGETNPCEKKKQEAANEKRGNPIFKKYMHLKTYDIIFRNHRSVCGSFFTKISFQGSGFGKKYRILYYRGANYCLFGRCTSCKTSPPKAIE